MSALGIGVGIPAVSGSVAATYCPRTPGYWANHPDREEWSSDGVKAFQTEFYNKYGYTLDASNLLDPSKGDKTLIMAKHLLATILNFQGVNHDCVDNEITRGPYKTSTVRKAKQDAEDWMEYAEPGQKKWDANGMDGEAIKDTLDYFNNNPQMLGIADCPCYGDD